MAAAGSTSTSAVSRRFVAQTRTALAELLSRDLSSLDIKVLMVDGEHLAERCCVVALGRRRNVAEHLPKKDKQWVDAKLATAFTRPGPQQGPRAARHLAIVLDKG